MGSFNGLLSGAASQLILPAAQVRKGDRIFVDEVPHARPTQLTVGWHEVLEVQKHKSPKDVISFRVLPASMDERNDVLPFNRAESLRVQR